MEGHENQYISLLWLSQSMYTGITVYSFRLASYHQPFLSYLNRNMATMKAVGVSKYGPVDNLESRVVPKPGDPNGRQVIVKFVPQFIFHLETQVLMLFRVKACSVNPIDHKVRSGTYDDAPGNPTTSDYRSKTDELIDYYEHVPKDFHIIGFDGAGIIEKTGPDCQLFKVGDEVSWVGPTTEQGTYAEYQLVNELACAKKPKNLDFVDTASYGLTFMTAYQSLYRRMEVKPEEQTAILIVSSEQPLTLQC